MIRNDEDFIVLQTRNILSDEFEDYLILPNNQESFIKLISDLNDLEDEDEFKIINRKIVTIDENITDEFCKKLSEWKKQ